MTSPWTPARVERLTELWHEGVSARLIGKALGVSKNAVVGKIHRTDLPGRLSPVLYCSKARVATPRQKTLARATLPSEAAVPPEPPESEVAVPLPRRPCQFIEGEKGRDFALYAYAPRCPAAVQPGSSYCPVHDARCHVRRQPSEAP